jgi:alkanesulfonate monooxygenase SsuD/methylene tetrahydromethanopterin reductase-like flavin-dependent oxidoreductase (luciferase family)
MTGTVTFGVGIRPQHWPWANQIGEWPRLEAMGFESIWLNDHLHSLGDDIDAEAFDASTTLAAMALSTKRVRLGVLTYSITHRNPIVLFKQIVTIDQMSGGRVVLGIGAGWHESEHAAYAIPFPGAGERVARLDEALTILRLLEANERTTFRGRFYTLDDAPFAPKPVHGRIPILIGGTKPKMLGVIGKHADIWDASLPAEEYAAALRTIREHARTAGRDPTAVMGSASVWTGPVSDGELANTVRAYHRAGARQFLFRYGLDRAGVEEIPRLMEQVVPELKAELGARSVR